MANQGLKINENYLNLGESYLFVTVNRKEREFLEKNPDCNVIKLGIGDITLPLVPSVLKGLQDAVTDLSAKETFKGYADEQGYDFLISKVKDYYSTKSVDLDMSEIFISDGSLSDIGNVLDIFSEDNSVLIPDPVYPAYVDTNIMAGRKITYMDGNEANNFLPMPSEDLQGDIIYLCSPNNPTGTVYNREQLKAWVDFANKRGSVILYDAAYEIFVDDADMPSSIYEIEGAKTCAIEMCSFSKTAGFTGVRCGYTVVPRALVKNNVELNRLWLRRQTTKFNGVSYISQKGAEAAFSEQGLKEIKENISYYKGNAKIIADTLTEMGIWFTGGISSPYIWMKCPNGMSSWDFFDKLLEEANVVGTPGSGFGKMGEGYLRLTAFNTTEKTKEAMERFKKLKI